MAMIMKNEHIDGGSAFDWGRTSSDYAKFRDIYPPQFYERILALGLCTNGQQVLDIGTGTGVLPRSLYAHGAHFTGTDIAHNQIGAAKALAEKAQMDIRFFCCPAEELDFPSHTFDVVTACQCFFYFDHTILAEKIFRMLKPGGKLAVLYMAWLPYEDEIARESESLVLKYNPSWTGCRETRHPIAIPDVYSQYFQTETQELFDLHVPFTRESWNGRMKACRGIGASLPKEDIERFETEHLAMLHRLAPEGFTVLHYAAITVLTKIARD